MKATLILQLTLLCVSCKVFSQNGFNKTYDTAQLGTWNSSIIRYSNKYICNGILRASNNSLRENYISIYTENGSYLMSKVLKDSIDEYTNDVNTLVINKSSIYGTGYKNIKINNTTRAKGVIYKFDLNGDTLWSILIHDTDLLSERVFYSIVCYNNFIYCSGFRGSKINGVYKANAIVVKLDTLGNIIWENRLPSVYKFNIGFYLVAHNNKMYVSGNQWNNPDSVHSFSFNIAENGIAINYREYFKTNFSALITKVFDNGDYLAIGTNEFGVDKSCGYIGKYNTNGVLLWEKEVMKYNYWSFTINNDVFEDSQGNLTFFCTGYDPYETLYNTISRYKFFIYKTTANGDSLWMKSYSRDDAHVYASDWVQNDDGGFTICGSIQGPAIPGSWDAWLMRVDKDGCIDEFCTPVGIKEETPSPLGRDGVGLYPNPATDVVTIESNEAINKIEIINSQGQIMETINCNNTLNYRFYTLNYPNGIYFIKIIFDENTSYKRLVINK